MKNINELTEHEILELTNKDIDMLIRLKKAEEGVRMTLRPESPLYEDIDEPEKTIYSCGLFGQYLVFEDVEEMKAVIDIIKNSKTKSAINTTYSSDVKHTIMEIKPSNYSSAKWDTIETMNVYSEQKHKDLKKKISNNKKLKEQYEKEFKEYEKSVSDSRWIEDEINERTYEVRAKYDMLNSYCNKFKNDYLPIAEDNKEIAMKFMSKAYPLTDDEESYVLENYNSEPK